MKITNLIICIILFINTLFFLSCQPTENTSPKRVQAVEANLPLLEGRWRADLTIDEENDLILPFNFDLQQQNGKYIINIINAQERIEVTDVSLKDDSIFIKLPIYNSEIKGKFISRRIYGAWYNYAKGADYHIPLYAVHNDSTRFNVRWFDEDDLIKVGGRWEVAFFNKGDKTKSEAIGEFTQNANHLQGTFLTPTGDYRFLEGNVTNEKMYLSCFDGAHAFLFIGNLTAGSNIEGKFWSGNHWQEQWIAFRNDTLQLPDAEQLTFLKKGYDKVEFSFPNLSGKNISLADERYKGKVVMVQILGTWCPNCKDETALYTELYKKYKYKGLEIIGLAFESAETLDEAFPTLKRYQEHFNIDYELLYVGKASKKIASEALPMLNQVMSFPTTIFLDRTGKVVKIHTGFAGPATKGYDQFVTNLHKFLDSLL